MLDYMPLNDNQLHSLTQGVDPVNPKVRFVDEKNRAICIVSGRISGDDWIYYDRPEAFISQVINFLNKNNPGHQFRAVVVPDAEVQEIEDRLRKLRDLEVPYS